MAVQIQMRRDTAAAWLLADPLLAEGEFGYETDTGKWKNGNGIDIWSILPYLLDPTVPVTFPLYVVHPAPPASGAVGYVIGDDLYVMGVSGNPKLIAFLA